MGDWTQGELTAQTEGYRQRLKTQSAIAYREALLTGATFAGGAKALPEVYEVFPYWTAEEIREMKLSKYKALMMRYAARGGGGHK